MRIIFLLFLATMNILSCQSYVAKSVQASEQRLETNDKERDALIRLAYDKAKELGYKTEELNLELSRDRSGDYTAYFYPKQKPGTVTYGGSLTIYFDKKGKILRFERGI